MGGEGIQFPSWTCYPHVTDRGQTALTAWSSPIVTRLLLPPAEARWDTVLGVLVQRGGSWSWSSLLSPAAFSLALAGEIKGRAGLAAVGIDQGQ